MSGPKSVQATNSSLVSRNAWPSTTLPTRQGNLQEIMGKSGAVLKIEREVEKVASTNLAVVITGETGSGKEVVARAISDASTRAERPFIAVDCGSFPENLIESELFGHERGAFTGAHDAKPGKFKLADHGTLFLDEVANCPLIMQAKLLRALQEKRFYPVGATERVDVDLRVLAASNMSLRESVEQGTFRRDLFHRLHEFEIHVPPLRERREDIPYLAARFLAVANEELGKGITGFSDAATRVLVNHAWLGNVRELRNVIRRAALLAHTRIEVDDLGPLGGNEGSLGSSSGEALMIDGTRSLWEIVREKVVDLEAEIIQNALKQTEGNKAKAARLLRIDYKTMHNKAKLYGTIYS